MVALQRFDRRTEQEVRKELEEIVGPMNGEGSPRWSKFMSQEWEPYQQRKKDGQQTGWQESSTLLVSKGKANTGSRIKGIWWDIKEALEEFESVEELAAIEGARKCTLADALSDSDASGGEDEGYLLPSFEKHPPWGKCVTIKCKASKEIERQTEMASSKTHSKLHFNALEKAAQRRLSSKFKADKMKAGRDSTGKLILNDPHSKEEMARKKQKEKAQRTLRQNNSDASFDFSFGMLKPEEEEEPQQDSDQSGAEEAEPPKKKGKRNQQRQKGSSQPSSSSKGKKPPAKKGVSSTAKAKGKSKAKSKDKVHKDGQTTDADDEDAPADGGDKKRAKREKRLTTSGD